MELDLDRESITHLLALWAQGDDAARRDVFARIYPKLHKAAFRLGNEVGESALVSLIHDVFVRLSDAEARLFNNREHFAAVCVRTLRSVLIDRLRRQDVRERHAGAGAMGPADPHIDSRVVDVQRAIAELAQTHEEEADAITLKHWGGLGVEQIAELSGCSVATVGRRLKFAKFFLTARLHEYRSG